jgi:adenosylmethionine-8-amino-7-oxononanoate aminotransferase
VEFVKDKKTLQPFPRRDQFVERLWQNIFRRGVVLYRSTGLAGTDGDALVIGPPFVIEEDQLDLLVSAIQQGLEETLL